MSEISTHEYTVYLLLVLALRPIIMILIPVSCALAMRLAGTKINRHAALVKLVSVVCDSCSKPSFARDAAEILVKFTARGDKPR